MSCLAVAERPGRVLTGTWSAGRSQDKKETDLVSTLDEIAALLPGPCPEPGIAQGNDMCPCGSGEVWPCNLTRAAWLAAGADPEAEVRRVLDALREQDPDAARRKAIRDLGW
jgi:hypothetical protein